MQDYSLVVTSCGRFDLLEATLRSLRPALTGPLEAVIVVEDSGRPEVVDHVRGILPDARVLVNETRLGQLASIDRAYSCVRTPYIVHCEDDWLFGGVDFLEDSFVLLQEFPRLSLVSLRARQELNRRVRDAPAQHFAGIRYFQANPAAHPEYFGYSFNPGLRRLGDYQRIGPFATFRGEREISYCFKRLGYTMAYLENACVTHIGDERHVDDPQTHLRARNVRQRLAHSCRIRIDRLHRKLFPARDPAVQIERGIGRFAASRLSQRNSRAT